MKLKMAADQVLKRFSRQIRKEDATKGLSGLLHALHGGRYDAVRIRPQVLGRMGD
jgi:hypothetical protein